MDKSYKFFTKPDSWFKEKTEAKLLEYVYTNDNGIKFGIFNGTYVVGKSHYDTFWYNKGYHNGDEVKMDEMCSYNEFYTLKEIRKIKLDKFNK